jgi:hypothetical protein
VVATPFRRTHDTTGRSNGRPLTTESLARCTEGQVQRARQGQPVPLGGTSLQLSG